MITLFPSTLDKIEELFGGQLIGQILISIVAAATYPSINLTIGKQENFERITEKFLKKSHQEQAKIAKKGAGFFSFSMIYFVFIISLKWILSK